MSCEKCDQAQEDVRLGGGSYFMRIGRANVLIVACEEHFRETQRLVKAGMASEVSNETRKESISSGADSE